jgi:hypothetical protein
MEKIIRYIDQLVDMIIPNNPARTQARHLVLPYSNTALPSPSFPTRPGSPTPIDSRSGGLLINYARYWTGREPMNRRRCASIA